MKRFTAFVITSLSPVLMFAEETASGGFMSEKTLISLGVSFAISLAAVGCGIAMGKAITAAVEGTARNPEASKGIFTLLILGLALIEALVIYVFVVSLMLLLNL
ncbi:MAG: ATP synthase F0 subunit C [bacterium]